VNGRFRAGKLWDGTAYQTSKGGMVVLDVGWVTQNIWEGTKRSTCAAGIDPNTVQSSPWSQKNWASDKQGCFVCRKGFCQG